MRQTAGAEVDSVDRAMDRFKKEGKELASFWIQMWIWIKLPIVLHPKLGALDRLHLR